VDVLLNALAALADDYAAAVALCRKAVQRLSSDEPSAKDRLRWLWQGCVIAFEIWDDEHASSLSHSSVEIARTTGTLGELSACTQHNARSCWCSAATSPPPPPLFPKRRRSSRRPESAPPPTQH
jgi:hypothetical protein